jgi:hypothetical protein
MTQRQKLATLTDRTAYLDLQISKTTGELIQIIVKVFVAHRPMVGTHQLPLQERHNLEDAR